MGLGTPGAIIRAQCARARRSSCPHEALSALDWAHPASRARSNGTGNNSATGFWGVQGGRLPRLAARRRRVVWAGQRCAAGTRMHPHTRAARGGAQRRFRRIPRHSVASFRLGTYTTAGAPAGAVRGASAQAGAAATAHAVCNFNMRAGTVAAEAGVWSGAAAGRVRRAPGGITKHVELVSNRVQLTAAEAEAGGVQVSLCSGRLRGAAVAAARRVHGARVLGCRAWHCKNSSG